MEKTKKKIAVILENKELSAECKKIKLFGLALKLVPNSPKQLLVREAIENLK